MTKTKTYTAREVAKDLKLAGIKVLSFAEGDDQTDGEVVLLGKMSVQVGLGYIVLNQWDKGKLLGLCSTDNPQKIIKYIKGLQ